MWKRLIVRLVCGALSVATPAAMFAQKPYHIETRWVVGGEGGWDYLMADSGTHRLYLTHTTKVDVIDTSSGKVIGSISGLTRCHGVVITIRQTSQ